MRLSIKTGFGIVAIVLLALTGLIGCGDGGEESPAETTSPTQNPTETPGTGEKVVITIGNITDLTGVASSAHHLINISLNDLAQYFNDEILGPGVELEIIAYDGQTDPSKDIPGYEWLKENGADLIFTCQGQTPVTLKSRVDNEEIMMFVATGDAEAVLPPGYVFSLASMPQYDAYTMLKWIADNDWDYLTKGPAKIGGATWDDAYGGAFFDTMEEYAEAHPDQFEWIGGYVNPFGTFTWGHEVEALKDADYIFPCVIMTNFVKEYRDAGYSAKFIGTGIHTAFIRQIGEARLWDEIDGMLFIMAGKWWGEEGTLIDLTEDLLYKNHPSEAEKIMKEGSGYMSLSNWYPMFDIIAKTIEATGPDDFDSQALFDTAESYSRTIDGIKRFSFSNTKRDAIDSFRIFKASADEEDLVLADPEWLSAVHEP